MNTPQTSNPPSPSTASDSSWVRLVSRIQAGNTEAIEELYGIFSSGVRFLLCRQLGPQDLDDRVHDAFVTITQAIQHGDVREPERLMGYIRTVVRRQIAAHIEVIVQERRNCSPGDVAYALRDHHPDPEHAAIENQRTNVALKMLQSISPRDREVLVRFYLKEQPAAEICRELNLTDTQFRLIKSRAKARFGELGRRRFSLRTGFRP